jgi:hypothetical protein
MANRYGEAAILAARQATGSMNPAAQWKSTIEKLYPTSPVAQNKKAPREAFLGLCEAGLVTGIAAGEYTKSKDDKESAVRAVALLLEGKQRWSRSALWQAVAKDAAKPDNGQMDVVLALWNNNLIVGKPPAVGPTAR